MYKIAIIVAIMAISFAILFVKCSNSSSIDTKRIRAYHHAGMNDILVNGERIHIHFSKKSNEEKITLLGSLNCLIPDDHLVYIGVLHNEWNTGPYKDDNGNDLLEGGERYKYFDLVHWYIICPFYYNIGIEKYGDRIEFIKRYKLEESDLGYSGFFPFNINDYMLNNEDMDLKQMK